MNGVIMSKAKLSVSQILIDDVDVSLRDASKLLVASEDIVNQSKARTEKFYYSKECIRPHH